MSLDHALRDRRSRRCQISTSTSRRRRAGVAVVALEDINAGFDRLRAGEAIRQAVVM